MRCNLWKIKLTTLLQMLKALETVSNTILTQSSTFESSIWLKNKYPINQETKKQIIKMNKYKICYFPVCLLQLLFFLQVIGRDRNLHHHGYIHLISTLINTLFNHVNLNSYIINWEVRFFFFETGFFYVTLEPTHSVDQAVLELNYVHLPLPPEWSATTVHLKISVLMINLKRCSEFNMWSLT